MNRKKRPDSNFYLLLPFRIAAKARFIVIPTWVPSLEKTTNKFANLFCREDWDIF